MLAIAVLVASYSLGQRSSAPSAADDLQIVGTWRGNSNCMEKEGPCRDEVNVYRISKIARKPGSVSVTGSKIVESHEIVMDTYEWNTMPGSTSWGVPVEPSDLPWTATSWKGL